MLNFSDMKVNYGVNLTNVAEEECQLGNVKYIEIDYRQTLILCHTD